MPIINVRNVTYTYHPGTPYERKALDDVSFTLDKGELLGIIGANGSGKSTLIQHLNGLLIPDCGDVIVLGRSLRKKEYRDDVWQHVGLLFQFPERQVFESTVHAELAYGLKNMGLAREAMEIRVREGLEMVGLIPDRWLELSPFFLSGGTLRRVAIASILAMRPEILILDEPTAGLDPEASAIMIDTIVNLKREYRVTVIWVSHCLNDLLPAADRIAILDRGNLGAYGPTRAVLSQENLRRHDALLPDHLRILFDLKARGWAIDTEALTVDAAAAEIVRTMKAYRQ